MAQPKSSTTADSEAATRALFEFVRGRTPNSEPNNVADRRFISIAECVAAGADIGAARETVLLAALHPQATKPFETAEVTRRVKELIHAGADVTANNNAALRWAVYSNRADYVALLLANGATATADGYEVIRVAATVDEPSDEIRALLAAHFRSQQLMGQVPKGVNFDDIYQSFTTPLLGSPTYEEFSTDAFDGGSLDPIHAAAALRLHAHLWFAGDELPGPPTFVAPQVFEPGVFCLFDHICNAQSDICANIEERALGCIDLDEWSAVNDDGGVDGGAFISSLTKLHRKAQDGGEIFIPRNVIVGKYESTDRRDATIEASCHFGPADALLRVADQRKRSIQQERFRGTLEDFSRCLFDMPAEAFEAAIKQELKENPRAKFEAFCRACAAVVGSAPTPAPNQAPATVKKSPRSRP